MQHEQILPTEVMRPAEIFNTQLDSLGNRIPEVHTNHEDIQRAGQEIISTFDINPELFDDEGRSIVFAAIANRWSKAAPEATEEKTFLHDSIALLAHDYSPLLVSVKEEIKAGESPLSPEAREAVYDKYTDTQLTEQLRESIKGGLLDGVRERMAITPDNEDPFDVRVLSITAPYQTLGLSAPALPDMTELPPGKSAIEILNENSQDRAAVKTWEAGLEKRSIKFKEELGEKPVSASAWVTDVNGKRTLCITMPLAEKVLDPELTKNEKWYGEDDTARDLAIVEHEYTHTQGGLNVDYDVNFGINIEELRAEHFSGNKHGYMDIKAFFMDYWVATGQKVSDIFDRYPKGGTQADIYSEIANHIGLDETLDVLLATPQVYVAEQGSAYLKNATEYTGRFDGILERLIKQQEVSDEGQTLRERVAARAERIVDITSDPEGLLEQRRYMGLRIVSDLIEGEIKQRVA